MVGHEDYVKILINTITSFPQEHNTTSDLYQMQRMVSDNLIQKKFLDTGPQNINLPHIGEINIPFVSQGAINTSHLFGLDELIIFSYYIANKNNYKTVADVGANIGVHSVILAKLGFRVLSYEPDPETFKILRQNLERNNVTSSVEAFQCAVSKQSGEAEFTRVCGNTTGSHLSGSKVNPYGNLERFQVRLEAIKAIMSKVDLVKIDIEGHEASVICSTDRDDWSGTNAIAEVGSEDNASLIFEHLNNIGINIFSQKNGWSKAESYSDLPFSHREGSIFISENDYMSW